MQIAIKEITAADEASFADFLKTERKPLPGLLYAPLVYPHEDICCIFWKSDAYDLQPFAKMRNFVLKNYTDNITTLSRHIPIQNPDNSYSIFSVYVFYDKRYIQGQKNLQKNGYDAREIQRLYGEFNLCTVSHDKIHLSSDFFGMCPWIYYEDDSLFIAANHYHLALDVLQFTGKKLKMDIARSRVNMITSGYMFGSPFSVKLDICNFKINLSYEDITYSALECLKSQYTELWYIITKQYEWDEEEYEDLIIAGKKELEDNCYAVLASDLYHNVVVDISGGFDSRAVFAAVNNLPKKLRKKIYTHTRRTRQTDDMEIGRAISDLYHYPLYSYNDGDSTLLWPTQDNLLCENYGKIRINLAQISRTLGLFSVTTNLYTANIAHHELLELSGHGGDICMGYNRIRGELKYELGDKKLLARLGSCYIHNNVEQLLPIFKDQENIILSTINQYSFCDCLFKKLHILYLDFRNRFLGTSHRNIEHSNLRIPICISKNLLAAKMMYFSLFHDNQIPDDKISIDVINALNPLIGSFPYAKQNDQVITPKEKQLHNADILLTLPPENNKTNTYSSNKVDKLYRKSVIEYMDNIDIAEQMLLHIYDYDKAYYPVCLGLYKVLEIFKTDEENAKSSHGRETIRKIYDIYYQIQYCK